MNLIEQLGGYENAKAKIGKINHTLENSELLGGGDAREGLYERLESIEKALLEYRRQHNIFEVGDWFVSDATLKPFKIVEKDGDYLKLWCKEHTAEFSGNAETITKIFNNARHATDAEIKAGKRL